MTEEKKKKLTEKHIDFGPKSKDKICIERGNFKRVMDK